MIGTPSGKTCDERWRGVAPEDERFAVDLHVSWSNGSAQIGEFEGGEWSGEDESNGVVSRELGNEFARCSAGDDCAVDQHVHLIGQRLGFIDEVGGQNHGGSGVAE